MKHFRKHFPFKFEFKVIKSISVFAHKQLKSIVKKFGDFVGNANFLDGDRENGDNVHEEFQRVTYIVLH